MRSNIGRLALPALTPLLALSLLGCFSVRTRNVGRVIIAPNLLDATLEQLEERINAQDAAIQTLNATVDIAASSGGGHEGQVKEIPTFAGYIFLRKPADLRVLLLVPVLRSRALDMVSDGKNFKLLIPPKNRAMVGADKLATPSKNGLENLRPSIIRDALLVPARQPDEYVALTRDSRILPPAPGTKDSIEEPDYDLTVLHVKSDHVLERVRVIHLGRLTLLPYQQDIYDHEGRIITVVNYDKFQKVGAIDFPMSIIITRPIDEYKLKIDISKLVLNQKLDDEQFTLKIPEGIPVQKM